MTKGKNKSIIRQKIRHVIKNVDADVGKKGNTRLIHQNYKSGVSKSTFAKARWEEK